MRHPLVGGFEASDISETSPRQCIQCGFCECSCLSVLRGFVFFIRVIRLYPETRDYIRIVSTLFFFCLAFKWQLNRGWKIYSE